MDDIPPHNCSFAWGIWTPSNACFFVSTQVNIPNDITIGSASFAWLTLVIDRQTNRQTTLFRL